jgi:hypothetical protein
LLLTKSLITGFGSGAFSLSLSLSLSLALSLVLFFYLFLEFKLSWRGFRVVARQEAASGDGLCPLTGLGISDLSEGKGVW